MKERKRSSNARIVFTAILLLAIAAFILFAVFSPRRAEVSDGTLHFKHLFTKFDVPLADIASAELLEELPPLSKITGIGVYFLSEGKYEVEGYGRCTVSVNQAEPAVYRRHGQRRGRLCVQPQRPGGHKGAV